ncbi:anoctamin-5 isoform 2-T2 [Glossina fuscipes fuscipes]
MNSNTQHKQLKTRISSEDETSTAPITEASSHEDLISRDTNDSEEKAKERKSHADGLPFSRFLSVPSLRNVRTKHLRRPIASSPAKSERLKEHSCPSDELPIRRLSQDSGIVAGRLFVGGQPPFVESAPPAQRLSSKTYSENTFSFVVNEQPLPRNKNFFEALSMTSMGEEMTRLPSLNYYTSGENNSIISQKLGNYNENSRPTYQKLNADNDRHGTQLSTNLESCTKRLTSIQPFGPKVENNEIIPGTAMHHSLGLQLSTPPTPDPNNEMDAQSEDNNTINNNLNSPSSDTSNMLPNQFAYKQLMPYEGNLTHPSMESSLDGSYHSNHKVTMNLDNGVTRKLKNQDNEGLDDESLMFRDGRRKIDMVVAWEEENLGVMTESESRKRDCRRTFMENLIKEGLEVELEDKMQSFNEKTFFMKIHLPWRLETRLGEVMNIKLPTKRFITISVKPSWVSRKNKNSQFNIYTRTIILALKDEDNIVTRNVQHWKDIWQKITKRIQLDHQVVEGEISFKSATRNGNPEEQFIVKDRATAYTSAQRSFMVMQVLVRTPFDDSDRCGIRRLLNDNTYLGCFPLHEGRYDRPHSSGITLDRRILYLTWAHPSQWYKKQPLCLVRKYFGDKIALYFCWLGFYTEMLVYPAIVGTLCFLYGLATLSSEDNTPSKEICNESGTGNITLCPLCDKACSYQHLYESCLFSRITYLFDNPSTVFFAIFMSFWATTFLELWKRKQSVIVWEWDLRNVESDEENRPEFETNATNFRINPVTREREPYMSTWNRWIRFAITGSAVLFMITIVLSAVLGTIIYRISVVTVIYGGGGFFVKEHAKLFTTITAALINLVVIMILTKIYHRLAIRLTNLENPRTQTEYEDSYTFKIFFFEFMNFYSSLIYIAFFKGRFFDYPGDDQARRSEFFRLKNDICDPAGCLSELCIQLAIIMVGKQCWNNFMEYLFPKFYNWWRQRKHKKDTKDESHLHMAWEQDYHMQDPGRLALFDEYLEMILQYGFVTLFVAAFPLAPLFALLNNVAEIRLDAYKMVTQARRPLAERVEDIGAWYGILRIITYTAVVSNAFVIAYTSDFIPRMVYKFVYSETYTLIGYIEHSLSLFNTSDYKEEWGAKTEKDPDTCAYRGYRNGPQDYEPYGLSPHYWHVFAARLAFVVVFEHVVFVLTGVMQFVIPDIPAEVQTQMQREQLLAKEAKYQHGIKRAQGDKQDLMSLFRETSNRNNPNTPIPELGSVMPRRSWARRFSRLSDTLDAHVEVAGRPKRSTETSTVWEVS